MASDAVPDPLDLAALRQRAQNARERADVCVCGVPRSAHDEAMLHGDRAWHDFNPRESDAVVLASAVLALCDEVERLQRIIAEVGPLTVHTRREWRAVTADGGITVSEFEGARGEWREQARLNVQEWIDKYPSYAGGMHLECWEQQWSSTEATWAQVAIDGSDPSAFPVEEM